MADEDQGVDLAGENGDEDALGQVTPIAVQSRVDVFGPLAEQKRTLRWVLSIAAIIAASWLLALFSFFICTLIEVFAKSRIYTLPQVAANSGASTKPSSVVVHQLTSGLDWHVVLLGSLMVVPATAILLVMVRFVFQGVAKENEQPSLSIRDLPAAGIAEEIMKSIGSAFKSFTDRK